MARFIMRFCSLILLLVIVSCNGSSYGKGRETVTGVVVEVLDGDSFVMKNGKTVHEVRMWGIDCPEYTQSYSSQAKSLARSLIEKKRVSVEVRYRDRYDRDVGMVYLNGANINGELVRRGAAWVYRRYCDKPICGEWEEAEKQAREGKKGLWRHKSPVPPWQWRRRNG